MREIARTNLGYSLRDYQHECLKAIIARYRAGIRRQLVCLPTGCGKTVIFAEFPGYFRMKKQMLVLAHRAELLDQAQDKIRRANPGLCVEVEQGDRRAELSSDVVVASIQTLGRRDSKRLQQIDPDRFFLIVVDEAHHATASTYKRVFEYLGALASDTQKLLVGFTATPKRGDGVGLDSVFEEIVFSNSLPEMTNAGYLIPLAGYRVETEVDLSKVKTRMGDFITSHLSRAVNIDQRNNLIVDIYSRYLKDRPTLCFCVDVAHAYHVADAFNAKGISAKALSGHTELSEREHILNDFREKRIQVLANCLVLTEGYDEPTVSGIILARPTKSSLLYTQMIGRGTRLHPNKKDTIIIDITDVTRDHSITTLPSLFGISATFNLEGRTTGEVQEAIRWVETNRPWVALDQATSLSDLRYRCNRIELDELSTPEELVTHSHFAWVGIGKGGYRLGLSRGIFVTIVPTILGVWEALLHQHGKEILLAKFKNLCVAVQSIENYIRKTFPDSVSLVVRNTHWRRTQASQKQLKFLRDKHIHFPSGLTKGQASHIINMLVQNE